MTTRCRARWYWRAPIALVAALLCGLPNSALSTGTVTYSYDAQGRLTQVEYANGVMVTYVLDAAGNRTSVTTSPAAPGTPGISLITTSSATATWTAAPTGTGGGATPTGYEYTLDGGASWNSVGTALTASLSGLTIGTGYTVAVRAFDAQGGRGGQSSTTFNTAPPAPGTVTIINVAQTTATASWGAATDSAGISGYEYSLDGGTSWTDVGNVLSVNLTGLTAATQYTFSVRALDAAGTRGGSSSATFTTPNNPPPSAPGTPAISNLTGTSATATWAAATDNVGVSGYEYSINGGSSWTNVGNTLTANITGLTSATQYTFSVRAYDPAGIRGSVSSATFTTPDTVPPSVPGVPVISNITGTSATATWSAATDNVGVTGYEYSINGGSSWVNVGNALTASITGLTSAVGYTVSVRAYDAAGNRGGSSSATFTTLDTISPLAPGALTISNITGTSATVTWTAATDNVGVTGYEYTLNSGSSWTSVGNALTTNLTGLTSLGGYTISVRAYDAAGNRGGTSTAAFFTRDTIPPSAPGVPTISNVTSTSATAAWSAATDNSNSLGYEYSLNGGSSWTDVGNALTASLTGLTGGTHYTFSVRGYDPAGNRGPSTSSSFTTLIGTPSLTSWGIEACNGTYLLEWTSVSGATSYNVLMNDGFGYSTYSSSSTTSAGVTVPRGDTDTFEVQACTGSTCGAASSPTPALRYYSGCP